jgi:hypothetical protein
MKNNNDQQTEIRKARSTVIRRATTDVLINPAVIEQNMSKLASRPPRRKRKTNYEKKIQNNPLIFNA